MLAKATHVFALIVVTLVLVLATPSFAQVVANDAYQVHYFTFGDGLATPQTNLLVNGSFEIGFPAAPNHPGDNTESLAVGSTEITGWTVINGEIAWINTPNPFGVAPTDGSKLLDLTGYHDSVPYGGVAQTVATFPGIAYTLAFDVLQNPAFGITSGVTGTFGPNAFQADMTNASSPGNHSNRFSFDLVATTPTTLLTISGDNTIANTRYIGLDNVTLTVAPSSIAAATTVHIINTGQIGSPTDAASRHGQVCADIYVFDANQEMLECCSCPITANGLKTLSVANNLLNAPLTGVFPATGVIKVVSDAGCNEQSITTPVPAGLRASADHFEFGATTVNRTETNFQSAPLTNTEAAFLGQTCAFVQYLGSGKGRCTCGIGF